MAVGLIEVGRGGQLPADASRPLMNSAMPAAASRFRIRLYRAQPKPPLGGECRKGLGQSSHSIGSPNAVPVPCASISPTASAEMPAWR